MRRGKRNLTEAQAITRHVRTRSVQFAGHTRTAEIARHCIPGSPAAGVCPSEELTDLSLVFWSCKRAARKLSVGCALVLQPSPWPAPARVVVGPMEDPALVVPFILPAKRDPVARPQVGKPGREVYVVADKQRLPRADPEDESLVSRAVIVVAKNTLDDAAAFDHLPRAMLPVEPGDLIAILERR